MPLTVLWQMYIYAYDIYAELVRINELQNMMLVPELYTESRPQLCDLRKQLHPKWHHLENVLLRLFINTTRQLVSMEWSTFCQAKKFYNKWLKKRFQFCKNYKVESGYSPQDLLERIYKDIAEAMDMESYSKENQPTITERGDNYKRQMIWLEYLMSEVHSLVTQDSVWLEFARYGLDDYHRITVEDVITPAVEHEHSLLASEILFNTLLDIEGCSCQTLQRQAIAVARNYFEVWWDTGNPDSWHPNLKDAVTLASRGFGVQAEGIGVADPLEALEDEGEAERYLNGLDEAEVRRYLVKMQKTWVQVAFFFWFEDTGELVFQRASSFRDAPRHNRRFDQMVRSLKWLCRGSSQPWHIACSMSEKTKDGHTFVQCAQDVFPASVIGSHDGDVSAFVKLLMLEKLAFEDNNLLENDAAAEDSRSQEQPLITPWGLHPIPGREGYKDIEDEDLGPKIPVDAWLADAINLARSECGLPEDEELGLEANAATMRHTMSRMGKVFCSQMIKWFIQQPDSTWYLPMNFAWRPKRKALLYGDLKQWDPHEDDHGDRGVLAIPHPDISYQEYDWWSKKTGRDVYVLNRHSFEYDKLKNVTDEAAAYVKAWAMKQEHVGRDHGVWIPAVILYEVENRGRVTPHFQRYIKEHAAWAYPAVAFLQDSIFALESDEDSLKDLGLIKDQVQGLLDMAREKGAKCLSSLFDTTNVVNKMCNFLHKFFVKGQKVYLFKSSKFHASIVEILPDGLAKLGELSEALKDRRVKYSKDADEDAAFEFEKLSNLQPFYTETTGSNLEKVKQYDLQHEELDRYRHLFTPLKDNLELFRDQLIKELQKAFGNYQKDQLALPAFGQSIAFGKLIVDAKVGSHSGNAMASAFKPTIDYSHNKPCPACIRAWHGNLGPVQCPGHQPWLCHKLDEGIVWAEKRFKIESSFAFESDDDDDFLNY